MKTRNDTQGKTTRGNGDTMALNSPLEMLDNLTIQPIRNNINLLKELHNAASAGHTYIPEDILNATIEDPNDYRIVTDEGRVYLTQHWEAEVELAANTRQLIDLPNYNTTMPTRPTTGPLIPTDDQWKAISNAFTHPISIICGYPGTGKTSLVQLLLHAIDTHPDFMHRWSRYQLAAPTGKAARRLTEATTRDASTIHRLLGYNPNCGFMHNESFPLFGDFIIIDESSMIDIGLASALLKAVGTNGRIVFVGDAEQLPPIKPGRFFEELIKTDIIPKVTLTQVFRQAKKSLIVQNAHRIIKGLVPYPDADIAGADIEDTVHPDFIFVEKPTHMISQAVTELIKNRLPTKFKLDPMKDILTISPMRPGAAGLDKLNDRIKKELNSTGIPLGIDSFSVGDRIIQTQNDYTVDIMNGEIGTILGFDIKQGTIHVDLGDRKIWIPDECLGSFLPGYAISIHRSQGSQARVVIVILDKGHRRMLNRRLINTAITRAQDLCIVIGQWESLCKGVEQNIEDARCDYIKRVCS